MPRPEEYLFEGSAFGVTGRMGREQVPTYGVAALSPYGGISDADFERFGFRNSVSIQNGWVRTYGMYDSDLREFVTFAEATLENIRIRDIVQIGRISARLRLHH